MRYKFIDKITKITGDEIWGLKNLTLNEDIFEDHFPNLPMFPAAMMIEASIELSRYYVWKHSNFEFTSLPTTYNKCKFYRTVTPSNNFFIKNNMKLQSKKLENRSEIFVLSEGFTANEKLFKAQLTLMVFDFSKFHDKFFANRQLTILLEENYNDEHKF